MFSINPNQRVDPVEISIQFIACLIGSLAVGGIAGILLRKKFVEAKQAHFEAQGKKLIEDALAEAEQLKKEALLQSKDEAFRLKQEAEKEIKERKADIIEEEKRFSQKLDQIERKIDLLDKREFEFLKKEKAFLHEEKQLAERKKEIEVLIGEQRLKLEKIIGNFAGRSKEPVEGEHRQ